MVQDLIDAQNLYNIMLAFERRMHGNKRWRKRQPNKADKILEKINEDFEEWNNKNTRQKMH